MLGVNHRRHVLASHLCSFSSFAYVDINKIRTKVNVLEIDEIVVPDIESWLFLSVQTVLL